MSSNTFPIINSNYNPLSIDHQTQNRAIINSINSNYMTNNYLSQKSQFTSSDTNIQESQQLLIKEIKNIKLILKNQMENQNIVQSSISEFNRKILLFENNLKISNSKMQENEKKVYEISKNINNNLKMQSQYNDIIKQNKKDIDNNLINTKTFQDFKNYFLLTKQGIDSQLIMYKNIKDEDNLKFEEIHKIIKEFKEYIYDKIRINEVEINNKINNYKKDSIQNYQSLNDSVLAEINQLKKTILAHELNFQDEGKKRKFDIEKVYIDIQNNNKNIDTKLNVLQKNILEAEKNLISLNKDYSKNFNDLILKHKDGLQNEIDSIKSIIITKENELNKIIEDNNIKNCKRFEAFITELNKYSTTLEELEVYSKSNISEINKNIDKLNKDYNTVSEDLTALQNKVNTLNTDLTNKVNNFSSEFNKLLEENIVNVKNNMTNDINNINDSIQKNNKINKDNIDMILGMINKIQEKEIKDITINTMRKVDNIELTVKELKTKITEHMNIKIYDYSKDIKDVKEYCIKKIEEAVNKLKDIINTHNNMSKSD